jgi:wyosine [tRNA(Phe)-imidazoG37] synthetase (radical SAM superfamily)
VSIGLNLNPDKVCNFDCVYCQVDRTTPGPVRDQERGSDGVDPGRLRDELEETIDLVHSGRLFDLERFRETPPELRRLNDVAFSGDGEPTTCPRFAEVVDLAADARRRHGLDEVKLVLITNATQLHRPRVQQGLATLRRNNGEVWAKLEAGTEEYYRLIDRTTVPFRRILDNITAEARLAPLVIQAMFLRLHGEAPPAAEREAFCDRLNEIVSAGGRVKLVQVYTVARRPAEEYVAPLDAAEVDSIVDLVRRRTGLAAEPFYGPA